MERSSPAKSGPLGAMPLRLLVLALGYSALAASPNVPLSPTASNSEEHVRSLRVEVHGTQYSWSVPDTGRFYTTERPIHNSRLIEVPNSPIWMA